MWYRGEHVVFVHVSDWWTVLVYYTFTQQVVTWTSASQRPQKGLGWFRKWMDKYSINLQATETLLFFF